MGFNNHAQRSTPPYYLDVDNPLEGKNSENKKACAGFAEDKKLTFIKIKFSLKKQKKIMY